MHVPRLVTVSYVQLHPAEHLAIVASAGHLPTLVVAPGQDVAELPSEIGPPLGAVEEALSWQETTSTISTDATLTTFTDGLVEQRDADITLGLQRIRKTLAAAREGTTEDVATALLQARSNGNDDDVAVLVARVIAPQVNPSRRQVTRRLPPTPASVFVSRRFAKQISRLWSVPEEISESIELAISELATNAARHSEDVIEVHLVRTESCVRVAVGDSSHRMPRVNDVNDEVTAGRGLFLVEAVSDRWGVDFNGLGKTVWCEFDLPTRVV